MTPTVIHIYNTDPPNNWPWTLPAQPLALGSNHLPLPHAQTQKHANGSLGRRHGLSGSWLRPSCPSSSQLTSLKPLQYLTLLSSWGGSQPWPMVLRLSWGSPGTSGEQGLFLCLGYWGLSPPHVSRCSFVCRVKAFNHIT